MTIHVAAAFDARYINPFYAFITSLLHNNGQGSLALHIICSDVKELEKQSIKRFVRSFGNSIYFYELSDERIGSFLTMSEWTQAVYYRLYFPLVMPKEIDRVLYLDTDTIVLKPLNELYEADLDNKPVGAVADIYVSKQPLIGITTPGDYFNSGMLLIDVARWRRQNISEKAIEYLQLFPERIKFVDQCALNAVLAGNWKKLHEKYNLLYSYIPEHLSRRKLSELLNKTHVLHFTLQRPWHMLCKNRFRFLYTRYLKKSPCRDKNPIIDFSISKLPALMKLRIIELYHDMGFIKKLWQFAKAKSVMSNP